jgi:hypothetical protein
VIATEILLGLFILDGDVKTFAYQAHRFFANANNALYLSSKGKVQHLLLTPLFQQRS